jgi:hypothetical protein
MIFYFLYIYIYKYMESYMKKAETKLTSVKIISDLYQTFRISSISENGITLQKLVNRSINLYLNDEDYKNKLNNYNQLQTSGSAF